jgi:ferredoxin
MSYNISELLCPQNHRCPMIRICPARAIEQEGYGLPVIDESKCTDCGKCSKLCPTRAVKKKV